MELRKEILKFLQLILPHFMTDDNLLQQRLTYRQTDIKIYRHQRFRHVRIVISIVNNFEHAVFFTSDDIKFAMK